MKTADEISSVVAAELERIADPLVREGLEAILVIPWQRQLEWEYGAPGEAYPGWMVAEDRETDTGIAWCDKGFGPENPWGLVFLSHASMGMDSGWFAGLEEAFCDSFAASPLEIWMVVRRDIGGGEEITAGPMDMHAAFDIQKPLNEGADRPNHHVVRRAWDSD